MARLELEFWYAVQNEMRHLVASCTAGLLASCQAGPRELLGRLCECSRMEQTVQSKIDATKQRCGIEQ